MFGIHRQCKNIYDNRFKYGDAVVNKFGRKGKILDKHREWEDICCMTQKDYYIVQWDDTKTEEKISCLRLDLVNL